MTDDKSSTILLLALRSLGLSDEDIYKLSQSTRKSVGELSHREYVEEKNILDTISHKLHSPGFVDESEIITNFSADLDKIKRVALDPTCPACDVCGPPEFPSYGGVIVEDDNYNFAAVCQQCWDYFTTKEDRVVDTWFKKMAVLTGTGTDPKRVYEWLPIKKTFAENVRDFQVRHGPTAFNINRDPLEDGGEYCIGCLAIYTKSSMIHCKTCKLAMYCSTECMGIDSERHTPCCMDYMKSFKSQKRYRQPGVSNCHECYKKSKSLQRCTGCKDAVYCNSTCQKKDWVFHKALCKTLKTKSK